MNLQPETVRPLVQAWAADANTSWSDHETDEIIQLVTRISGFVTPAIGMDAPLGPEDQQDVLLSRTRDRIECLLAKTAASLRKQWNVDALHIGVETSAPSVGLRSATLEELEALPVLGQELARRVAAHLAAHPELDDLDTLEEIHGLGPAGLAELKRHAYLDRSQPVLTSPSNWRFVTCPSIVNFLVLLEHSDLSIVVGDQNTIRRRLAEPAESPFSRFIQLLGTVLQEEAKTGKALGKTVLASEAVLRIKRRRDTEQALASLTPMTGGLLFSESYVPAVKRIIDETQGFLDIMMFLGTAAPDISSPSSLALIEAVEQAHARGVEVRVIMDRDEAGDPYKSYWINRPLVDRLRAAGISVKFDEKGTLLHSKLLIADRATTVVGSHNWTRNGLSGTHDVSTVLRSEELSSAFILRFESLWDSLANPA